MDRLTKKKVLLISPDFGYGGAERSIAALSVLLAPHYDLHFVVFNEQVKPAYSFAGQLHSLHVAGNDNLFGKMMAFRARIRRLKKIKRQINPDASISFLEGGDYVNVLSGGPGKIILSLRGSKKYDENIAGLLGAVRKKILIPFLYRKADWIVSVAQGILNELEEEFRLPGRVRRMVIPNHYDMALLQHKAGQPLADDWMNFFHTHVVFIAVGRLAREKGFHKLAAVFGEVRKKHTNVKLVIVGSGDFEKEIHQALASHQLSFSPSGHAVNFNSDVIFAGYQPDSIRWIAKARFFVLSSFTEGFPNVLIEAMIAGTPVMAADCPYGPAEILSEPGDDGIFRTYGMLLPRLNKDQGAVKKWEHHILSILENKDATGHYPEQAKKKALQYTEAGSIEKWRTVIG